MLLELLGQITWHFFIKSSLKINGKCSWNSLGKLPDISLLNPYWKSMGNAPELPGPLTFLYWILIESQWKISLELLWSIPSGLLIKSLLKINGKCSWNSLAPTPLYVFFESSLKTHGECAWISPSQFHGISLLNLDEKSMENDPGAPWASSFVLLH